MHLQTIPARFEDVTQALYKAFTLQDYESIDAIIENYTVSSFTRVVRSKTPIFTEVANMLGSTEDMPVHDRPYVTGLIVQGLEHIFDKIDSKLASGGKSDKELLHEVVHASCNHVSHTALLPSGGTVRDLLEHYIGADMNQMPKDKAYVDVYKLVNKYKLAQTQDVLAERTKTRVKGREL